MAGSALPIRAYNARKAVGRHAGNRRVNNALRRGRRACRPGLIGFLKRACLHLLLQMRLRKGQFGKEHNAGGFGIQPMHGMRRSAQIALHTRLQCIAAL